MSALARRTENVGLRAVLVSLGHDDRQAEAIVRELDARLDEFAGRRTSREKLEDRASRLLMELHRRALAAKWGRR